MALCVCDSTAEALTSVVALTHGPFRSASGTTGGKCTGRTGVVSQAVASDRRTRHLHRALRSPARNARDRPPLARSCPRSIADFVLNLRPPLPSSGRATSGSVHDDRHDCGHQCVQSHFDLRPH